VRNTDVRRVNTEVRLVGFHPLFVRNYWLKFHYLLIRGRGNSRLLQEIGVKDAAAPLEQVRDGVLAGAVAIVVVVVARGGSFDPARPK